MKKELKRFKTVLHPHHTEYSDSQRDDEEVLEGEDEEQGKSSREAFLKIVLHVLRRMKQEQFADILRSSMRTSDSVMTLMFVF